MESTFLGLEGASAEAAMVRKRGTTDQIEARLENKLKALEEVSTCKLKRTAKEG